MARCWRHEDGGMENEELKIEKESGRGGQFPRAHENAIKTGKIARHARKGGGANGWRAIQGAQLAGIGNKGDEARVPATIERELGHRSDGIED